MSGRSSAYGLVARLRALPPTLVGSLALLALLPACAALSSAEPPAAGLRYADILTDPIVASIYSLPSTLVEPGEALAFLRAVREHAPEREVLVLADPPMAEALRPEADPLRLHLVPTGERTFSPWPRDPFSTAHDPAGGLVLHDRPNPQPGREADAGMAEVLVRGFPEELARAWGGVRRETAPLPFHNGHVLLAGGAAWVSLHSLEPRIVEILGLERVPAESFGTAEGIDRYLEAGERAMEDFTRLYGKPVRPVHPLPASGPLATRVETIRAIGGGGPFDLDSLITFLPAADGGLQALVGSPPAGLRLLAGLGAEGWAGLAGTYGIEVPSGGRPSAPLIAYQTGSRAVWLGRYLDLVAAHLAERGIAVDRLPLVLVPTRLLPDPDRFGHPDFVLGWNNVVVEVREGRATAEGFSSGIPSADARAREIYAGTGTRLELLPPLVDSVTGNGGYRCASNQVRRPAEAP